MNRGYFWMDCEMIIDQMFIVGEMKRGGEISNEKGTHRLLSLRGPFGC